MILYNNNVFIVSYVIRVTQQNIMPVKENIVNESSTECSGTEEKLTVNNTPVDISREDLRDGLMTYLEVSGYTLHINTDCYHPKLKAECS